MKPTDMINTVTTEGFGALTDKLTKRGELFMSKIPDSPTDINYENLINRQFKNQGGKEVEYINKSRFNNTMPDHNMTSADTKRHMDTLLNTDPVEMYDLFNKLKDGFSNPGSFLRESFKKKMAEIKASEKTETYEVKAPTTGIPK